MISKLELENLKSNNIEITEVPLDWEIKELNQVTTYVDYRGKTPKKQPEGILLVTAKNIKNGYIDYSASQEYIALDDYENVMKRGYPKLGEVLFTTEAPLGNVAQVDIENIALAQRVIKFNGKEELDNTYLKYYMLSEIFKSQLYSNATGSTVKGIQGKRLHKLIVLVPPFKEQQKIAKILSAADEQIEKTKQLIEKTKELKKGLMQQLLIKGIGHTEFKQTELGEIPKEWGIKPLKELAHLITKGTSPSSVGFTFTQKGINFIKVESLSKDNKILPSNVAKISEECHRKLSRSILEENDLLISIAGTLGRTGIVKKEMVPANTNQALAIIRLGDVDLINFLYYFLQTNLIQKRIKDIATTGAQPNLSLKQIGDFRITLPSLNEQRKIVGILFAVDYQIETYKKEKETQIELKKALMQQLLTGKIRVTV